MFFIKHNSELLIDIDALIFFLPLRCDAFTVSLNRNGSGKFRFKSIQISVLNRAVQISPLTAMNHWRNYNRFNPYII